MIIVLARPTPRPVLRCEEGPHLLSLRKNARGAKTPRLNGHYRLHVSRSAGGSRIDGSSQLNGIP